MMPYRLSVKERAFARVRLVLEHDIVVDVRTKELLAIEVSDDTRADNAYFSSVKWQFEETVRATNKEGMAREMMWKFGAYSLL